jgi:hypothetical protein
MIHALLVTLILGLQNSEQPPAMVRFGAWLPRLGGTIQDGVGAIDLETNIDLSDQESIPLIEFTLAPIEDITLSFSVFDYSTAGSGLFVGSRTFGSMSMAAGDSWTASTSISSVGFEGAWDVIKPFQASQHATLTFAPIAGLQWFGVDTSLQNLTSSESVSHSNGWVALQGGLQMRFDWDTRSSTNMLDSITIDSKLLIGTLFGEDGGSMWSLQTGIVLQFSQNVAGYFGYRLQELNAEDGNYTFNAGLQGLFVGGEIRF